MLETRKHLALVGERDQEGFEGFFGSALRSQQVIGMPAPRAAADDLEALTGGDALRAFRGAADVLQQQGRPHAQRRRQCDQCFQAGRDVAGLEPAQHSGADPGAGSDIREGQMLAFAHTPRDHSQLTTDVRYRPAVRARRRGCRCDGGLRTRHTNPLNASLRLTANLHSMQLICTTVTSVIFISEARAAARGYGASVPASAQSFPGYFAVPRAILDAPGGAA